MSAMEEAYNIISNDCKHFEERDDLEDSDVDVEAISKALETDGPKSR
jgi:hypothetical protein